MANTTITPSVAAAALTGGAATNWQSTGLLYITEFESQLEDSRSGSIYPHLPPVAVQRLPFGANVSAASLPLSARTRLIRLSANTTCSVRVASAAVAGVADMRVVANLEPEYYAVKPGDTVAAIQST